MHKINRPWAAAETWPAVPVALALAVHMLVPVVTVLASHILIIVEGMWLVSYYEGTR